MKGDDHMNTINRRDFLKTIGGISGLVLLDRSNAFAASTNYTGNPLNIPSSSGLLGVLEPTTPFTLTAQETNYNILPGRSTRLWVYETTAGNKNYVNPIIKIKKGNKIKATLKNKLPEPTITHWHGLHVDFGNDGHPSYQIDTGEEYPYEFQVQNRAATYWYHTHAHQRTGIQAYLGLASYFIVEDDEENQLAQSLDLKFGETDIPLVIQDKTFDGSGNLIYNSSTPMGSMNGFLGDTILTNLTYKPFLNVATRMYRFRILNGSNARIYRFAFLNKSLAMPFSIIGNDGGLLDRPYQVSEVFVAPGERVDVLLDLSRSRTGDTIWLNSLYFDSMNMGMMGGGRGGGMMGGGMMGGGGGGMMGGSRLPNGSQFPVLRLNVTSKVAYNKSVPQKLSSIIPINITRADTRPFNLSMYAMSWLINGQIFQMDQVPVTVYKDSAEIWQFNNTQYGSQSPMGGMMSMPHPMHLHGFQFQVLERINSPAQIRRLAVDSRGLLPTDKGLKDTVLVWPRESVRVAVDFSHNFSGIQRYLLHCHILEHEDNGMMMNYEVV
jgi:suppressor of ftsI/bilirubin oxidase